MEGNAEGQQRDIVLLNATFGIHVSGKADTLNEAKQMAVESIESGAALKALNRMSEATNDVMNVS